MKNQLELDEEESSNTLYKIPPKNGRYVVIDTETTGFGDYDNIIQFCAREIINGKLTINLCHKFLRPRSKIKNKYFKNSYNSKIKYIEKNNESEKDKLISLLNFIGNSLIFAHNANFDMKFINKELIFNDLQIIPRERFRCSMMIFKKIINIANPLHNLQSLSLEYCSGYFGLGLDKKKFHDAKYDSTMTAHVICKLYSIIDNNPLKFKTIVEKKIHNYNNKSFPSQYTKINLKNNTKEDDNDINRKKLNINFIQNEGNNEKNNPNTKDFKILGEKRTGREFDGEELTSSQITKLIIDEIDEYEQNEKKRQK